MPSKAELVRLGKVLGLLSSTIDGERSAAAFKAEQLRQSLGVSWADLLTGGGKVAKSAGSISPEDFARALKLATKQGYESGYSVGFSAGSKAVQQAYQPPPPEPEPEPWSDWRDAVRHLVDHHYEQMDGWEQRFCLSLLDQKRRRYLSEKQQSIVGRMMEAYCG
jgi:hypothetical protein